MKTPADKQSYLTASELAAATDSSPATIWRLKRDGKIPFYQPGGKHHLVKFPPDAIEQRSDDQCPAHDDAESQTPEHVHEVLWQGSKRSIENSTENKVKQSRLSGPTPKWMR